MATLVLDPVTRLEGHLKIEVVLDANNTVTSAKSTGQMFRNFENLLIGRVPKDAAFLTQRICGLCPISHAIASAKAVEKVLNFNPNLQAVLLRSLVQGANYLSNHVLHFYHLALTDYVQGPQMSPWTAGYDSDLRFSASETAAFNTNYLTALAIRRKAQEMGAIIGGKLPHAANIVPGGITALPSSSQISDFRTYLNEIQNFITGTYQSDVNKLAAKYSDYSSIGKGYGNLISYGVFDTNTSGAKLFAAGTVTAGKTGTFSEANIKEYVGSAWYSSASGQAPASGSTTVNYGKTGAYSYIKAPRYNGLAYEAGPIARMWVSGDYRTGISVMDRHKARCAEAIKIAKSMQTWLNQIVAGASAFTNVSTPATGSGVGLTEAARGALGHWISISGSKITRYQIITPTCWNASPKDDSGKAGPIEQALVGVKLANPAKPVELLRIIHSFDPCTACAVHVISPTGAQMSQFIEVPAEVCN